MSPPQPWQRRRALELHAEAVVATIRREGPTVGALEAIARAEHPVALALAVADRLNVGRIADLADLAIHHFTGPDAAAPCIHCGAPAPDHAEGCAYLD